MQLDSVVLIGLKFQNIICFYKVKIILNADGISPRCASSTDKARGIWVSSPLCLFGLVNVLRAVSIVVLTVNRES